MRINSVEFRNDAGSYKSMFKSESYLLASWKDELVQIVKNEFERFGVALVYFDDLTDATSIKGFVFDIAEVAKNLLDFFLHA